MPRRRRRRSTPSGDAVAAMKKVALMVLGTAMQTYGEKLADEQEVLIARRRHRSSTSTPRRARCCGASERRPAAPLHEAAARVFVNDAAGARRVAARSALAAMAEGDTLRTLLAALRRLLKVAPVNTVALRRQLADAVAERRGYPF